MSAAARVGDVTNGGERKGPRRAAGARRVAETAQGPRGAAGAPGAATGSSRQTLPLLRRALKAFLRDLRDMDDLHVLRETLTFHDEFFFGDRTRDDGAQRRADLPRRFYDKVTRR